VRIDGGFGLYIWLVAALGMYFPRKVGVWRLGFVSWRGIGTCTCMLSFQAVESHIHYIVLGVGGGCAVSFGWIICASCETWGRKVWEHDGRHEPCKGTLPSITRAECCGITLSMI
jgi:hypothetical protein